MIDEEVANSIVMDVTSLLSAGRVGDGERFFLDNASRLPESLRLECMGNLDFYKRNLQGAVNHYEAAIERAPERVIARYQYLVGTQKERSGDLVGAFERYQAAIDAEPGFLDAYVELGGLLTKVKDYEGAAKCYQDALHIAPQDVTIMYNVETVLSELNRRDPIRYGAELKIIENAYEKLTQDRDVGSIQSRSW